MVENESLGSAGTDIDRKLELAEIRIKDDLVTKMKEKLEQIQMQALKSDGNGA